MPCAERTFPCSTPSRLLEGAERSLLSRGYGGASIRRIADEAGANVAAINYHFGSKKELFAELFRQRFQPVVERRAELLPVIESGGSISVSDIVRAYFGTLFRYRESTGNRVAVVIWMLLNGDPEVSRLAGKCLEEGHSSIQRRYAQALACLIPDVPISELEWRLEAMERFALCVIAGPIVAWSTGGSDLPDISSSKSHGSLGEELATIIQACMQAPPAVRQGG